MPRGAQRSSGCRTGSPGVVRGRPGGVVGPLRRFRSAAAVRYGHDLLVVPAAQAALESVFAARRMRCRGGVVAGTTRHAVVTVMRLRWPPTRRRPTPRPDRWAGADPCSSAAVRRARRVTRRALRCRRRPPVSEQLLKGERGGVVGGRHVDDDQARLAQARLVDQVHVRHYARRLQRVPPRRCLHPTEWQLFRGCRRPSPSGPGRRGAGRTAPGPLARTSRAP